MTKLTYEYVSGEPYSNFDLAWAYDHLEKTKIEAAGLSDQEKNEIYTGWSPWLMVANRMPEFEWKDEYKISVEESKSLLQDFGFDNQIAFDLISKYTKWVSMTGLSYLGKGIPGREFDIGPGVVDPHVHLPYCDKNGKYLFPRNTTVVIIPMKIVEPVTETVHFAWQDIPYEEHDVRTLGHFTGRHKTYHQINVAETYNDLTNEHVLKLPTVGQYLVCSFESSRYLHWTSNVSNNEFICVVNDCI